MQSSPWTKRIIPCDGKNAHDPGPWLPLLRAAKLVPAGKHAAFGMGEVRLA